jgi:polysaccharide export outer membrane protein
MHAVRFSPGGRIADSAAPDTRWLVGRTSCCAIVAVALSLTLGAPAVVSQEPAAPSGQRASGTEGRMGSDQAAAPSEVAPDYVIGPGDTVNIFVWRNPELSALVPVRPDGKISSPLVEDMVAAGKTTSQLAREMEASLSTYIRSPKVNVIVTSALSASSQVRVVGQAGTPRALPYRDGLTVLDVVIAVGGLGEFAAGNRAKIVRLVPGGKPKEIKVRLKNLIEKGDMSQNFEMKPGDVLVIPESFL